MTRFPPDSRGGWVLLFVALSVSSLLSGCDEKQTPDERGALPSTTSASTTSTNPPTVTTTTIRLTSTISTSTLTTTSKTLTSTTSTSTLTTTSNTLTSTTSTSTLTTTSKTLTSMTSTSTLTTMSETLTSTTTMLTTTTLPDACHPASSTLELKDGRVIPISHLRIGDRIRTPSGWEEVVVLGHAETVKASPSNLFVRITAGEYSAAFSSNHYIFVDGVEKAGGDVRVGEKIMTVAGERVIERVEHIMEAGLYDFFVPSGTYYIDGVMMSTYHDNLGIPLLVWD